LALGLRTLTLQTGDEYKKSIGLNDEELAVLIGSNAILNLHNKNANIETNKEKKSGSESAENLASDELIFNGSFDEDGLKTILKSKKDRQFLHAPILTCTIDYIIRATEITRGGKYILPTMRLMSSDLVIDEIDDFDGTDLIAIGRLIHLAGMLGRKVMISSATITPDLAEGYFNAYQSGWLIFAKMRNKNKNIGCVWIDEFKTNVESVSSKEMYQKTHQKFIEKRIKNLDKEPAKRKVNIVKCATDLAEFPNNYFATIKDEICNKHKYHCFTDKATGKKISIGVVRIANVAPCIKLTKFLLNNATKDNIEIKAMAYHSRQVLLMRHNQEQYLDKILKRKDVNNPNQFILKDKTIRKHIDNSNSANIIFVLVVTPVEEVGRDHDFDWAVIEPSSYRSFVQLAGRVLRHRKLTITEPNIGILQYNYRAIKTKGKELAFIYPGYQQNKDDLSSYDLEKLINQSELAQKLDATNRIQKTNSSELANLEHKVIADLLTNYKQKGAKTMQGWLDEAWWLSGIHQLYIKFRQNSLDEIQFLTIDDGFCKKSQTNQAVPQNNIKSYELEDKERNNLWFERDYKILLKKQANDKDIEKTALIYGEITLPTYGKTPKENQFIYNSQLGLCENN
jgi:CRISPR-associated endonuclease/helicase Cas3